MNEYDPYDAPDAKAWLEVEEQERIGLVEDYHLAAEVETESATLHAVVHVVVENQLALGVEPVPETIRRLMRQGLDRHESVHAVGAILAEDIFDFFTAGQAEFCVRRYRNRLNKLTAKRWRKGQY